jgi:hypothetical protein
MHCLLESISSLHDHLVLREPTRLSFLTSHHLDRLRQATAYLPPSYRVETGLEALVSKYIFYFPLTSPTCFFTGLFSKSGISFLLIRFTFGVEWYFYKWASNGFRLKRKLSIILPSVNR